MKKSSLESAVILSVGETPGPVASLAGWISIPRAPWKCGAWYFPSECGSIASTVLCWVLFIFSAFLNIYTTQPLNTS